MLETIEQALLSKQNDTANDTTNDTINDIDGLVFKIIEENPKVTIKELVEKTGKSRPTITRALSSLKKQNRIERVGANKNGYWKVGE